MSEDLDPEVAAAFAGVKPVVAHAHSDDLDPEVAAAFRGVGHERARMTSQPTRAQPKAAPKPAAPERELTWSETGREALANAIPSAASAGQSIVQSVLHPIKTLEAVGNLGKGAVSQVAGVAGMRQDPAQKTQDEGLLRALEGHYKETYGSAKGFKKAAAKDPVSIAMDAATFLDGVGAVGKVAGLTKTAGVLAKTASAIDPVANAVRVAKLPAKIIPHVQSLTTGKSLSSLQRAAEAGANPEMRDVFRAHLTGQAKPEEIVEASQKALSEIQRERGERYVEDMRSHTGGNLPAIPWKPVEEALAKNIAETQFIDKATGATRVVNRKAADALKEIADEIHFYRSQPVGAGSHTLEGFDALKKRVGDIRNDVRSDPVAYQKATSMYNAVLGAIKDQHPEYAKTMADYAKASDNISQIGAGFSLSNRSKAQKASILAKLKRAGGDDMKADLLAQLAEKDPRIPYMLAGNELNPVLPGGLRAVIAGSAPFYAGANPIGAAAHLASSSPRVSGELNYAAGRAGKALENAPEAAKAAYYANAAHPEMALAEGQDDTELTSQPIAKQGDAVWDRMVHQESGGKQFGANGETITSPKGALGIAQIMPGTGPEAARLAGDVWDEKRLRTDPEYGLKLGRAYYDHQLEKFGDPFLAAAAYNAGPGAVEQAVKLAKETGRDWLTFVPGETQNYVKVVSRGQFASGGAVPSHIEPLVQRLMSMAKHAKQAETKATKPLLGASDNDVAHALRVASAAI